MVAQTTMNDVDKENINPIPNEGDKVDDSYVHPPDVPESNADTHPQQTVVETPIEPEKKVKMYHCKWCEASYLKKADYVEHKTNYHKIISKNVQGIKRKHESNTGEEQNIDSRVLAPKRFKN